MESGWTPDQAMGSSSGSITGHRDPQIMHCAGRKDGGARTQAGDGFVTGCRAPTDWFTGAVLGKQNFPAALPSQGELSETAVIRNAQMARSRRFSRQATNGTLVSNNNERL